MPTDDVNAEREARGSARKGSVPELVIVFGLTVGVPLAFTLASGRLHSFEFGQARLVRTIIAEAIGVAVLWPWLASRGWALPSIAGTPEPTDLLRGCGVAVCAYVVFYVNAVAWAATVPGSYDALMSAAPTGTAAPWAILVVSLLNPVVEEFLWLAYGVTALSRYGVRVAVVVSIALRVAVHSYQGIIAFTSILPLAVVFTVYYARTRRLWPVIVAHVLFDTIALAVVRR